MEISVEISVAQFVILAGSSLVCIGSAVGIMYLLKEERDSDAKDR